MHKTGNVLDKMPKGVQKKAKSDLHEIWMAETKEKAEQAFNLFIQKYQAKYSKAVESPDFDSFSLFLTLLISETLDKSTFCFSISHFFIIL